MDVKGTGTVCENHDKVLERTLRVSNLPPPLPTLPFVLFLTPPSIPPEAKAAAACFSYCSASTLAESERAMTARASRSLRLSAPQPTGAPWPPGG